MVSLRGLQLSKRHLSLVPNVDPVSYALEIDDTMERNLENEDELGKRVTEPSGTYERLVLHFPLPTGE